MRRTVSSTRSLAACTAMIVVCLTGDARADSLLPQLQLRVYTPDSFACDAGKLAGHPNTEACERAEEAEQEEYAKKIRDDMRYQFERSIREPVYPLDAGI